MQFDMMTFGIPMVELMRKEPDVPLSECGAFLGPFAAGDPGITLNACCTLGHRGCYVGVVGADAFADCFLRRMRKSNIDTTYIRVDHTHTTGISMLANFSDGSRSFVFTLPTSAAALLGPEDIPGELLRQVRWIHVSGFAMSVSDSIVELHRRLMREIGDNVSVSFDPNYRKEMIDADRFVKICATVFERCNLFLPSRGEAKLFCPSAENDREACRNIAQSGKKVALKNGSGGCYGFRGGQEKHIPGLPVREVDPTGAGDTFGGTLIAALLEGTDFFEALRYANAGGAIAVSRVGLMDIAPTREDIAALLNGT